MRRQLTLWHVMVGAFYAFIVLALISLGFAAVILETGLDDRHDRGETGGEVVIASFLFFVAACFLLAAYLTFRWLRRS